MFLSSILITAMLHLCFTLFLCKFLQNFGYITGSDALIKVSCYFTLFENACIVPGA